MTSRRTLILVACLIPGLLSCWNSAAAAHTPARVALQRTPNGGIQPQAIVDPDGAIHLIYYQGEAGRGDLFYVRQAPGQDGFSTPLPVNSQKGSAIAAGTIRGAQLALGRGGRVHAAWNGPAPGNGNFMDAPMLYTRMNDAGTAFERERNVITFARGLDGGGSVAADREGNVYVLWHAPKPGNTQGEAGRAVFVARSTDEGKTFAPETLATSEPTGACGCCGMKALASSGGALYALYRAAAEGVNRDETLLVSRNMGASFEILYSHGWKVPACPMSSASLFESRRGILAAAETHGRVFYIRVGGETGQVSAPVSPPQQAKHPVIVENAAGEILLVWTEGTGWRKGGSVAWQVYDEKGRATSESGKAEGVPVWSLATAVARPDGRFVIIY